MAKMIHTMVRVLDLERSIEFYGKAFGLEVSQHLDFDDFALVYLRNDENDVEVELTLNKGREESYSHGDGYGHFAVCVDDLDGEHGRFEQLGLAPQQIVEFAPGGKKIARYFFVKDPDGYEIEVLERHGHYQ